ncbi:MAG: glycoside hydrolase family 3 N-terminal domain-containing protein [Arachnia sp.]
MTRHSTITTAALVAACLVVGACTGPGERPSDPAATPPGSAVPGGFTSREVNDGQTTFWVVDNPGGGARVSYGAAGGIELVTESDGQTTLAFKDSNHNGELDAWEDWRLPAAERAELLAARISIEQASGLMLFSTHEHSPADGLTQRQRDYLGTSRLRTILHAGPSDVEASVTWANQLQEYAESQATAATPFVPVSITSDPRSDARDSFTGVTGVVSQWPSGLGLAATFEPDRVREFAQIVSAEYRALGIAGGLSPQLDIATEPRSFRNSGTFGEDPAMVAAMGRAYVEGFQTTYDASGRPVGWGADSVAATIKHFPGDSMGEGGRDSHTAAGKYAVGASGQLGTMIEPFRAARDAASVMTSYSIITDADGGPAWGDRLVGSSFDPEILRMLREDLSWDGPVVTDWGVLGGDDGGPGGTSGTPWGVEQLTVAERAYTALVAGVDAFGGLNEADPVQAAYQLWDEAFARGDLDVDAETRWRDSAARVLTPVFLTGAYDDPFRDLATSLMRVGSPEFTAAGWQAQLDSIVVTKNSPGAIECSPALNAAAARVYIPMTHEQGPEPGAAGQPVASIDLDVAREHFGTVVTDEPQLDSEGAVVGYEPPDLSDVDLVIVGIDSPNNGTNFSSAGFDAATGTYYPLSLQYGPYLADGSNVRQVSIAGDALPGGGTENRSYLGQSSRVSNQADLEAVQRAVAAVAAAGSDASVVVALSAKTAVVPAEFEPLADAVVIGFGVSDGALLEIIRGEQPSRGRLPMDFPAGMDTVEANAEDASFDVEPYLASDDHNWAYGFGLDSCTGEVIG